MQITVTRVVLQLLLMTASTTHAFAFVGIFQRSFSSVVRGKTGTSTSRRAAVNAAFTLAQSRDEPSLSSTVSYFDRFLLPLKLCPFASRPLLTHPDECRIVPWPSGSGLTLSEETDSLLSCIDEEAKLLSSLSLSSTTPPPRLTSIIVILPPPPPPPSSSSSLVSPPPSPSSSSLYSQLSSFRSFMSFINNRVSTLPSMSSHPSALQTLAFHPRFTFSGSKSVDVGNYVNRSPHPMIHLLREEEVTKAIESWEKSGKDMAAIWEGNKDKMESLGIAGVRDLLYLKKPTTSPD